MAHGGGFRRIRQRLADQEQQGEHAATAAKLIEQRGGRQAPIRQL
jgi:hypothetical protein